MSKQSTNKPVLERFQAAKKFQSGITISTTKKPPPPVAQKRVRSFRTAVKDESELASKAKTQPSPLLARKESWKADAKPERPSPLPSPVPVRKEDEQSNGITNHTPTNKKLDLEKDGETEDIPKWEKRDLEEKDGETQDISKCEKMDAEESPMPNRPDSHRSSLSSVDSQEDQGIGRSPSTSSDSLTVTTKDLSSTRDVPSPKPVLTETATSGSAPLQFTARSASPPIENGDDTEREPREKGKESGLYVGFANLPNQVHRKSVKKGFEFTLMVVGESGLGKSTLVDSLFLTNLYEGRDTPTAINRIKKTVEIKTSTVEIEEKGVRLKLTVVDTPGFGDAVDSSKSWEPIVSYINSQYNAYLKDESGLNRRNIADNRVHCCLYFVNPVGHGLKPIDINVMKALHNKVNIVPVIAKADTLTKKEVRELKSRILREVGENHIQIYQFPEADEDEEDAEFIQINKELKESIPFAVVGSNLVYEMNGRKVRGRTYPWGVVDIENPQHCDFTMLRNMLIRTHMQDLKDVTQEIHYENFRAQQLAGGDMNPIKMVTHEDRKKRQSGITDERDQLLLQKELELRKMQEMLAKMQAEMAKAKQ